MSYQSRVRILPVTTTLLLVFAGCASSPERPYEALAHAEASIDQAEQAGARQLAEMALISAKENLAKARAAAQNDETIAAKRYAEEAALDADLAAAQVRSKKAVQSANEVEASIDTLREELARAQSYSGETT